MNISALHDGAEHLKCLKSDRIYATICLGGFAGCALGWCGEARVRELGFRMRDGAVKTSGEGLRSTGGAKSIGPREPGMVGESHGEGEGSTRRW